MRRVPLFEMHDFPGFPPVWRDLLSDFLSFFAATIRPYAGVAPVLADALKEAGTHKIVDLCSGAGQPIVARELVRIPSHSLCSAIRTCRRGGV